MDLMVYTWEEDPYGLQEALSSLDANFWKEAINDEIESIESNETWLFVDLHPGCKQSINCIWILEKETKTWWFVAKYKGYLVEKGFRQREKI